MCLMDLLKCMSGYYLRNPNPHRAVETWEAHWRKIVSGKLKCTTMLRTETGMATAHALMNVMSRDDEAKSILLSLLEASPADVRIGHALTSCRGAYDPRVYEACLKMVKHEQVEVTGRNVLCGKLLEYMTTTGGPIQDYRAVKAFAREMLTTQKLQAFAEGA
eukprot:Trichotokara_eunicae@DN2711_c0_g1_i2.p1